jgi:sodium transport system permease protein
MKTIITIFKKELLDSIRDRRTLITMVVIPLLLFPLLFGISSRIMISQMKKAQEKTLKVGLLMNGNAEEFRHTLQSKGDITLFENITADSGRALIETDSLDALIVFNQDFDKHVANLLPGRITLYFKSTERRDIEKERVMQVLHEFEGQLRTARFKKLNLDEAIIKTIEIQERNLASSKEKLAEAIGGFLPYLFIIFCFMGSMYPAIDLAAGEKERGTLETLLTSPAGRFQILLGKFGVVVLTGILSAVISILGLYLGMRQIREIPSEIFHAIVGILEFQSIALLISLLLPLTVFFAAILLSLSIFAKSFKEAQSIISPLMIVVIVPAFIGLMPGMSLDATTALIPILNVSLATKGIIAGTVTPAILAEVYLSLIVFAGLSLYICAKMFGRENTIFRGA